MVKLAEHKVLWWENIEKYFEILIYKAVKVHMVFR